MTTDTRPKIACRQLQIDGKTMSLTGIAKGAGMIQPNMATMLSFIGCDASVSHATLQSMLVEANRQTFNRITVDSDTSTNDAVVLMASGTSGIGFESDAAAPVDANWGRLAMAIGKVPTAFDPNLVDLYLGEVCLMKRGIKNPDYQEADGAKVMAAEEILLRVDLNAGTHAETVWTSDLSHDYIKINAEYRT
jgi:glutamate N-acetyltransferase/amino-acid N-acetyltransferase